MRNDIPSKVCAEENIIEKRQRILFESFETTPALSSEIQTSLEILRKIKAHEDNKKLKIENERQELYASQITEKEIAKVITGSVISEGDFEIYKVDQHYQTNESNKSELQNQDKEPYHVPNEIKKNVQHSKPPINTFSYKNDQIASQTQKFNRKDSQGNLRGGFEQNTLRAINKEYPKIANTQRLDINKKTRCRSQFRDSEPQGIRISSQQQVINKVISASPASNFISAKDKASAHRNYIDNQRSQNREQSLPKSNQFNSANINSNTNQNNFNIDDEDEEDLIKQMIVTRKIELHEPLKLTNNQTEMISSNKTARENQIAEMRRESNKPYASKPLVIER